MKVPQPVWVNAQRPDHGRIQSILLPICFVRMWMWMGVCLCPVPRCVACVPEVTGADALQVG